MAEIRGEQWLIRTASNEIRGPFVREHVQELVRKGELSSQDEVCRANHYWIFVHEREEILEHLGVEPPRGRIKKPGEEITATDTETETSVDAKSKASDIPEIDAGPEQTAILTRAAANRALREAPSARKPSAPSKSVAPHQKPAQVEIVGGEIERAAYWKLLAALGIVAIVFLVAGAIRIIWTQ